MISSKMVLSNEYLCSNSNQYRSTIYFTDMLWGSYHFYANTKALLNKSSNPAYQELNRRISIFNNTDHAEISLASEKFGVYAGISNQKYFVTYDWNEQLKNALSTFRLMKKLCIFNFYTVFRLQRFSPYTELFSHYALQLVLIT